VQPFPDPADSPKARVVTSVPAFGRLSDIAGLRVVQATVIDRLPSSSAQQGNAAVASSTAMPLTLQHQRRRRRSHPCPGRVRIEVIFRPPLYRFVPVLMLMVVPRLMDRLGVVSTLVSGDVLPSSVRLVVRSRHRRDGRRL
jgi:hypothetical protein